MYVHMYVHTYLIERAKVITEIYASSQLICHK